MKRPKMILFDFGCTLVTGVHEFQALEGYSELLRYAKDTHGVTAQNMVDLSLQLRSELGMKYTYDAPLRMAEVNQQLLDSYMFEYYNLEFDLSPYEREKIFWDIADPGKPAHHIIDLLEYLNTEHIRTGVISNVSYSGQLIKDRINHVLPEHHFEFILTSSDYVFCKPFTRIFELALRKAKLNSDEVWFCGDCVNCDVNGAHNCGMYPIWYTGSLMGDQAEPEVEHLRVNDWQELIAYIKTLE